MKPDNTQMFLFGLIQGNAKHIVASQYVSQLPPDRRPAMLKIAALVYIVVAPTMFLASMIALLSMSTGLSTTGSSGQAVLGAFAIGMGLGAPVAWLIAKQIMAARARSA
jgi:hypothetical protein